MSQAAMESLLRQHLLGTSRFQSPDCRNPLRRACMPPPPPAGRRSFCYLSLQSFLRRCINISSFRFLRQRFLSEGNLGGYPSPPPPATLPWWIHMNPVAALSKANLNAGGYPSPSPSPPRPPPPRHGCIPLHSSRVIQFHSIRKQNYLTSPGTAVYSTLPTRPPVLHCSLVIHGNSSGGTPGGLVPEFGRLFRHLGGQVWIPPMFASISRGRIRFDPIG